MKMKKGLFLILAFFVGFAVTALPVDSYAGSTTKKRPPKAKPKTDDKEAGNAQNDAAAQNQNPPASPSQNGDSSSLPGMNVDSCEDATTRKYPEIYQKCIEARNNPTAPTKPASANCIATFQSEYDDCEKETTSASDTCDADKDSGISQAKDGLGMFAVGIGQQMAAQQACTGMGKAVGAANAAVATFTQTCSSAKSSCMVKCRNLKKHLEKEGDTCYTGQSSQLTQMRSQTSSELVSCNNLDEKIQQGVAAVQNTMSTIVGAQNCAAALGIDTLLYCKQNPLAIGCSVASTDCSNATIAASSPVCICAKNPNDPSCMPAMKAADNNNFAGINSAGTSGGAAGAGTGIDGGLDNADWQGGAWKKSNDLAEDPGGNKGGRPVDQGSGSSGSGANPAAAAAESKAANVNNGFRGGAGGGSGGGYNGGGGNGNGGGNAALQAASAGGPDLRKFLPGGSMDPKARGIAGISGPDGITGPHTNIWQKIQNRYQFQVDSRQLDPFQSDNRKLNP
jgi:hypothetical protein